MNAQEPLREPPSESGSTTGSFPAVRGISVTLKRAFLSGVLVIVPVILTFLVLRFLFSSIDEILAPTVTRFLGHSIPGVGFLATILLVLLAGLLTRNVLGSRLFGWGEILLIRTPLVRTFYSAAKQLVEAVTMPQSARSSRVALVEYPRRECYQIGFIARRVELVQDGVPVESVPVFMPSTPTPVTGMVVVIPASDVWLVDMTPEEAIRFLVSGGIAAPHLWRVRRLSDQPPAVTDRRAPNERRTTDDVLVGSAQR